MELMPEPMALPGCCFKCRSGSSTRDFFIDFQFNFDDHGAVYICNECLAEMAHTAGYILPDEARKLKFQNNFLKEDNEDLVIKIVGLEQAIDGLRIAGSSLRSDPKPNAASDLSPADEEPRIRQEELDFGAGEPSEPLHDEGMAELSNDDSGTGGFKFSV